MRLLVGLGNPGAEYARNRHNIGFLAADALAERWRFPAWRRRFAGLASEGGIADERVILLKPQTYMNESGRAVAQAARFYKLEPAAVVVLHDELDLAPGKLRVKQGGGAAGHNGIRSIDALLGNDFWRVRIGIGHPGHKSLVLGAVLGNFAREDAEWIGPLIGAIAEEMPILLAGDANAFMSRVARAAPPPKPGADETDADEADGAD